MKLNKVDYNAKSIFDIDINFFVSLNIKAIISDLDNTLDQFNVLRPSSRVVKLKDELQQNQIQLMIVSNNHEKRVKQYAEVLNVKYLANARKPFKKRLLKFLESNGLKAEEVILIGDQLLTDGKLARNAKIKIVLTEPISKKEQFTTHFNRLIDRPLRKRYRKNGQLGIKCPVRKEQDKLF